MKKYLIFFILLFSLSACSTNSTIESRLISKNSDNQEILNNEYIKGILRPQEIALNMYGTHLLEDDMGTFIVYLESKTINLNNYLNLKVNLKGKLISTYDEKKIIEVENIEVLEDVGKKTDNQAFKSKQYTSEDFKIRFILMPNWQVEHRNNQIALLKGNQTELILITQIPNTQNQPLKDFVSKESDYSELTIQKYESLRIVNGDLMTILIDTKNGFVYQINFHPIDGTAEEKSNFYTFLKSFALLPKKEKIKICGGAGNIKCDSGYRCEINSEKEFATGVCVKIDAIEELSADVLGAIQNDLEQEAVEEAKKETENKIEIVPINQDIDPITETEILNGFYFARKDQKKPGTPNNWVFIKGKWQLPELE